MPRGIDKTEVIYIKQLLEEVREYSKLSLGGYKSYNALGDSIVNKLGADKRIAWVTLRRYYKNKRIKPVSDLLNILTAYIDKKSWKEYLKNARLSDIFELHHFQSHCRATKSIEMVHFEKLCNKFGSLPSILPFLINMVWLASELKHKAFFEKLFTLKVVFENHNDYEKYYLGQNVMLAMRENQDMAIELAQAYLANTLSKQYCFKNFVDEDCLDGYYGVWLDAFYNLPDRQEKDAAFYFSMRYLKAYKKNDKAVAKTWFEKIEALEHKKEYSMIVEERLAAIKIIEKNILANDKAEALYKEIMNLVKTQKQEYKGFPLYLLKYLFMAKKNDWICALVKLCDKYDSKTEEHWRQKHLNQQKIYWAYAYHLDNQKEKAEAVFSEIDTLFFDPFMYKSMMGDYNEVKKILGI